MEEILNHFDGVLIDAVGVVTFGEIFLRFFSPGSGLYNMVFSFMQSIAGGC